MIYFLGRLSFVIYFNLFYKIKIAGRENINKKGAGIICSNHLSVCDPLIISTCTKRKIHYMAKASLFKKKFFGFILRQLGAFPVNRDKVGLETFRNTMEILKNGKIIGIFSQGTRMSDIESKEAKAGVALFATKASCPVIPVGIKIKSFKVFSEIRLNIGEPMDFTYIGKKVTKEQLEEITETIMDKVRKLSE